MQPWATQPSGHLQAEQQALTGNTREKSGVQSSQQEDGSPVLLKNHTQGVPNDEKR